MHGTGTITWPDGRKFTGVLIFSIYNRIMWTIKNTEKGFLSGQMVENIKGNG